MKKYQVIISKSAGKELRQFPREVISKVYLKMQTLGDNPRPQGCKKLEGYKEDMWRVRAGDYRIIYSIDDVVCIVDIRHIGNRKDVYG
ncbi:MAG: type II toxin-antitoxin system RelE/ParE family toxin [Bacteroidota bacterium]